MNEDKNQQVRITGINGDSVIINADEHDALWAQVDTRKKLEVDDSLEIREVYQLNDCRQLTFDCCDYKFVLYYAFDKFLAIPNHNFILDLSREECSRTHLKWLLMKHVKTQGWNEFYVDAILTAIFDVKLDGVDDRSFIARLMDSTEDMISKKLNKNERGN